MLGYNETESPENVERYTYKNVCDDMKELLAIEKIDKAVIVGHDWGGFVAWRFAAHYTHLVHSLVVLCTPYFLPWTEPWTGWEAWIKEHPNFTYHQYLASSQSVPDFDANKRLVINATFRRITDPRFHLFKKVGDKLTLNPTAFTLNKEVPQSLMNKEEIEEMNRQFAKQGFKGPTNWVRVLPFNVDEEARLKSLPKEITVRTLFIAATHDAALPITPKALAATKKYVVGGLTIQYIAAGHWVTVEKPQEVNKAIEEWLNRPTRANL